MKGIKIRGRRLVFIVFLLAVGFLFFLVLRHRGVVNMDITIWANLLVAGGTISMVVLIAYIEIIRRRWGKPKVIIEFDNKAPFCRCATPEGTEESRDYVRIKVTNAGKSVAKRVRGKLVGVNTGNKIIDEFFDPLFLHWTSIEPIRGLDRLGFQTSTQYLDSVDLNAKEWDYLDVFSTDEKRRSLISIATSPQPRGCLKQFIMRESNFKDNNLWGEYKACP